MKKFNNSLNVNNVEIDVLTDTKDYRLVIDFKDGSYCVYYCHITNGQLRVDNSKVDPDDEFKGNCQAEIFNKSKPLGALIHSFILEEERK